MSPGDRVMSSVVARFAREDRVASPVVLRLPSEPVVLRLPMEPVVLRFFSRETA